MALDRARAEVQLGRNLGVGAPSGHQLCNVLFARSELADSEPFTSGPHPQLAGERASAIGLPRRAHPFKCVDPGLYAIAVTRQSRRLSSSASIPVGASGH